MQKIKQKIVILFFPITFGIMLAFSFFWVLFSYGAPPSPQPSLSQNTPALSPQSLTKKTLPKPYQSEYLIIEEIPFTSQAPFENWNQPWQDACEETSVLMAIAWARGFPLSPAFAAEEILKQVDFEEKIFGYHRDTDIADTARIIKEFYQYKNFEIREGGITIDAIKEELQKGNIVLVPLAGALLENPYFLRPPHYHMVVIIGYDDQTREFIVHEPGTKQGNKFRYRYENLVHAIHDWTGNPATILEGKKTMLVIHPTKSSVIRYSPQPL